MALWVSGPGFTAELTGIYCPDFKISPYSDIEVKFSEAEFSRTMDLERFSDGESVYIPPYQSRGSHMAYKKFVAGLKSNKSVAIKLPAADGVWMTFRLEGSGTAIDSLGKERDRQSREREGGR